MAILQMQKISIFALSRYCKDILETLQRIGVVQIEKTDVSDSVFYKEESAPMCASYLRNANLMKNAQEVLGDYCEIKTSFFASLEGRKPLRKSEYEEKSENAQKILKNAYELTNDNKRIIEAKAKIAQYNNRIESLTPWLMLDVPLNASSTASTKTLMGSFPGEVDLESLRIGLAEVDPGLELFDMEIVYSDSRQTCVFVLVANESYDSLMNAMRKMGFSLPAVSSKTSPAEAVEVIKAKIRDKEELIVKLADSIREKSDLIEMFRFFEDYYLMKADTYKQIENLSYTPHTFVLTGYIPEKESGKILKALEKFDAEVILEPAEGEDVPVAISNNSFAEPVEGVLLSYSAPQRGEIDPTAVMAIFYYIFFGLMFSDAGYGIVMAGACLAAVLFFKNMEEGLKKSLKMFFWCGVSTTFWGLLFGSFFGDAVPVIFKTFLNMEAPPIPGITTPIWFNPTVEPIKLLMFSFLLGIIHLYAGLTLQAINYIRSGKFMYAIYDDLSWVMLVTGAVFALLSTEMLAGIAGFRLPSVFLTIGLIMAGVGAVIILFCSARNRNPIKRLIKGAYNLYGVTSYLSDILSYSRLLALGLATGVVAQVFNQLGSMLGGGILGAVLFTVVFIVGHTLNIGINALGAYVHTNRLQFVEFFGKFYEGGGKEFAPYKVKTKYYNVKEEI